MPDKHEVGGSSPLGPTSRETYNNKVKKTTNQLIWGCSSAGRAPALQAGGHGFESHHLHQVTNEVEKVRYQTKLGFEGETV